MRVEYMYEGGVYVTYTPPSYIYSTLIHILHSHTYTPLSYIMYESGVYV